MIPYSESAYPISVCFLFYSNNLLIVFEINNEMAEAFNPVQKLENFKMEVIQAFDELYQYLSERRNVLLSRLDMMRADFVKNLELERAIEQMKISKDQLIATMTSNLIGSSLNAHKLLLDKEIEMKTAEKVPTVDCEYVEFRCYSEKIRKAINEIDLFEVIPEYVGRENPVLTACESGKDDGELYNPTGIAIDRIKNEVYVCDRLSKRIQVLSAVGDYIRQFGNGHLTEPYAICLSQQEESFVTDVAKECVLKFNLTGEFLKQVGSRGNANEQFMMIAGLCCEAGLIYVCDCQMQRIQIFDSELNFIAYFGYGELGYPRDIKIVSDTIYILPQSKNCIYCYNRDCTLQRKIELTGQERLMSTAFFFTIDKKGNFLVTDLSLEQIRIFSPDGVLKHILGTRQLPLVFGIALDNFDNIICVCGSDQECFLKF